MTARALIGLLPAGVAAEGQVRLRRPRTCSTLSERELVRLRGSEHRPRLPGPVHDAQSAAAVRRAHRRRRSRRARPATAAAASDATRPSGGSRRSASPTPTVARALPVPALGRHAAARRDRGRARPRPAAADRRRAVDGARRDDPEARSSHCSSSLQESRGMGLILITHDLRVAFSMCDRVYVLYAGSVLEVGRLRAARGRAAPPLHARAAAVRAAGRSPPVEPCRAIDGSVPDARRGRGPLLVRRPLSLGAGRDASSEAPALRERRTGPARPPASASTRSGRHATRRGASPSPSRSTCRGRRSRRSARRDSRAHEGVRARGRAQRARRSTGVSLEIAAGESVGLVGESGSGKTTLGRCLVGLETPTAGRSSIDGIDAADYRRLSDARPAPAAADGADDLPGPVLVAQPGADDRRDAPGGARRRRRPAGRQPRRGRRAARPRRPAGGLRARASRSRSRAASASASRSPARSRSGRA